MTRMFHPPTLERPLELERFDPILEGARYDLSRGVSLAIWKRISEDAAHVSGRRDEVQARKRFHEFAAIAARGGWRRPDPGRLTRVEVERNRASMSASAVDELALRVPGRQTLVALEERRLAKRVGDTSTGMAGESSGLAPRKVDDERGLREPAARERAPQARSFAESAARRAMALIESAPAQGAEEALAKLSEAGGETLPQAVRARMEALFGHRFAHVRIHTDDAAVQATRAAGARAVTLGQHLYFNDGQFAPGSDAGDRLLLHELTHVVQHDQGRLPRPADRRIELSSPSEPAEREARDIAGRVDELHRLGEINEISPAPPRTGSGMPLPEDVRASMEAAFGTEFSAVRIHESTRAEAVGALAYAQGTDIHFQPGKYDPHSQRGRELLGHELAHVVQQSQGRVPATAHARAATIINDDSSLEHEADELGAMAARGKRVTSATGAANVTNGSLAMVSQHRLAPIQRAADPSSTGTSSSTSGDRPTASGPAGNLGAASATPAEALQLARQGTRTDLPYRDALEQRYGTVLQNIEVYTGKQAVQACAMVQAQAFTVGNVIVFASDNPTLEIVAHEVVHVLQQGGDKRTLGAPPSNLNMSREGDSEEQEAHAHGRSAAASMKSRQASEPTRPSRDVSTLGKRAFQEGGNVDIPVLSRFPSPPDCHIFRPGLSFIPPIIKAGYDGNTYTAIKTGWESSSWERRWQIYDADDQLLYESTYTWPAPTLKIPQDVVAKGKAGGRTRPWSVWIKVTKTLVPFGGSDDSNFPHSYMKFNVYDTWEEYLADPGAKPGNAKAPKVSSDSLAAPGAKVAGSVADYGSVVAMHEAYLREIYDASAKGLSDTAQELVKQGVPQKDVAQWANQARNSLKATIRDQGNPILKRVFEERNLTKYGDKLGPSYEQLYAKYAKQGLTPEEINAKIIQGSGKANAGFNRWAGRLKFAGRLALALDICLAVVRVYRAPEGEKVKTGLQELARIGGALALGAAGAEGGAAVGAAIGAAFAGIGAAPGAVIGGIIGGIGGAILGGSLGEKLVEKLYEMFPPDDCKFEGDFQEGVKEQ